ncbi:hypothetical protein F5876DRAFT_70772, partial [Lentinula aff. lateritia]
MITRSRTFRASGNNIMNLTSLSTDYIPNATAVDSASASNTFAATPVPLYVRPDDNSDDNFHGEVQAYLDYTSEILNAQAEEVRLLRREVASVCKEKADLKMQHEADATARKKEYQCPVYYELAWDSYILPCGHSFCAHNPETHLVTCCPLCHAEVHLRPLFPCTIQQGVQFIAEEGRALSLLLPFNFIGHVNCGEACSSATFDTNTSMDHPMDDVPATNKSELPPAANDTEVPTAIPCTRRRLITRRPMNVIPGNDDLETPSAMSSNRRRKLSLSSDDDSSSQAEDIHEKLQKVTDKTLQKTGKAVRTDSTNCSHNSQAVDSTEVERRKLRGDVINKGRTMESLMTLNKQLQHSLADSR